MNGQTNIIPKCDPAQNLCELMEDKNGIKCGHLKTDGNGDEIECIIYDQWRVNEQNENNLKEVLRAEARKQGMLQK